MQGTPRLRINLDSWVFDLSIRCSRVTHCYHVGTFALSENCPRLSRRRNGCICPEARTRPAAVLLRGTVIGDVWLVADTEALAEYPDILRSGLPVFLFEEVAQLRGKTLEELKAIGMLKAEFPTSRVLQ